MAESTATSLRVVPISYYDAMDIHYLNIQGVILLLRERRSEANDRACNALLASFRQIEHSNKAND